MVDASDGATRSLSQVDPTGQDSTDQATSKGPFGEVVLPGLWTTAFCVPSFNQAFLYPGRESSLYFFLRLSSYQMRAPP